MMLNFNIFIRILLSTIFIFLSLIFFYFGYQELKNIKLKNKIEITKKEEDYLPIKKKKYDDLYIPKSFDIEETEKIKIIEKEIIIIVNKNDIFGKLIDPFVDNNVDKQKIIQIINKEFNLKKLKIGQKIFLYFTTIGNQKDISKIIIPLSFNTDLVLKKDYINSKYSIKKIDLPIKTNLISKKYKIKSSLYEDGQKADIPLVILSELIRLYSFDVDFQRDIREDNQLEIMYEIFHSEKRKTVSYGEIKYSNLIFSKKNLEYFIFQTSDGYLDYFNKKGENIKKTLMKTPLDGARISSNYGMRKHPILGYNKKHLGVDFAAPKGTPIYAAGNGIIEFAGRNGGYGKYIRIRHNSSYKTAYAHLNSFNKGISSGVRVNQGQTIGYVGSTGRSSGSHLHYEIIYQGKKINPMKIKLPSGKALKGKELKEFKNSVNEIYSNFLFHLFE